ncbi:thiosulfate oxidation carrier complex protein SoxZ [Methylomonas rivi]|uniref:Thiosulfate oxidation carrier complex protein SoxZ n=1 Tax=Methylomonas rivi TaxID=2952226 RepID=A0ABT1U4S1_9GAMM|nr:thiosulfate oxidation carrier complex protein SoxZ [Methylomonas sp. WSC-6]MBS4053092.1 thiosulfate oxidation carrier complex protein SoxZ [Methylomonas sp.]MCQ8128523.1 thiosulfate oxidation carrier complex protein SoxZ [Methylomonas sp. WSC-6]
MASSIKIRSQQMDGYTEIKLLLSHPMENGRNRDPVTGVLIPAHFIREWVIELNGKVIMAAELGGSMSTNPFFTVRLKNSLTGNRLTVRWIDNLGFSDSAEHFID